MKALSKLLIAVSLFTAFLFACHGIFKWQSASRFRRDPHIANIRPWRYYDEIGFLRWFEKQPGEAWSVVYLMTVFGHWDRSVILVELDYSDAARGQVRSIRATRLMPGDVRRFVFKGEGRKVYPPDIIVFRMSVADIGYAGHMGGDDVRRALSDYSCFIGPEGDRIVRIQCRKEVCWEAPDFLLHPGEEVRVTCYFSVHEKMYLRYGKPLGVELVTCGRAEVNREASGFVLDYGSNPGTSVDSLTIRVSAPMQSAETIGVAAVTLGTDRYLSFCYWWVLPAEPYKKTFLDEVASRTVADIPPIPLLSGEVFWAAVLLVAFYCLRIVVRKKLRTARRDLSRPGQGR
jgi:hypothetical protein